MLALEPSPSCTQESYSLIVICKTGATVNSKMSLLSYLKPDRVEPFNNIYYFYRTCNEVWGVWWPLSLLYFYAIPRDWMQGPRLAWQVPLPKDPHQCSRCELFYGINVYYNNGMSVLCNWFYHTEFAAPLKAFPGTFQYSKYWQRHWKLKFNTEQWSPGYTSVWTEVKFLTYHSLVSFLPQFWAVDRKSLWFMGGDNRYPRHFNFFS